MSMREGSRGIADQLAVWWCMVSSAFNDNPVIFQSLSSKLNEMCARPPGKLGFLSSAARVGLLVWSGSFLRHVNGMLGLHPAAMICLDEEGSD